MLNENIESASQSHAVMQSSHHYLFFKSRFPAGRALFILPELLPPPSHPTTPLSYQVTVFHLLPLITSHSSLPFPSWQLDNCHRGSEQNTSALSGKAFCLPASYLYCLQPLTGTVSLHVMPLESMSWSETSKGFPLPGGSSLSLCRHHSRLAAALRWIHCPQTKPLLWPSLSSSRVQPATSAASC